MSGQLLPLTAETYGVVTIITPQSITGPQGIYITGGKLAVIQGSTGVSLVTSGITITGASGPYETQLLLNTTLPYGSTRSLNGFYYQLNTSGTANTLAIAGGSIVIDPLFFSNPKIRIQYPAVIFGSTTGPLATFVYPQVIIPVSSAVLTAQNAAFVYGTITKKKPHHPVGLTVVTDGVLDKYTDYSAYLGKHRTKLSGQTVITDQQSGELGISSKKCIIVTKPVQPEIVRSNYNRHSFAQWVGPNVVTITDETFTVPINTLQPLGPIFTPTYNGLQVIFAGTPTYSEGPATPYQLFYATLTVSGTNVVGTLVNGAPNLATITVDTAMAIQAIYFA